MDSLSLPVAKDTRFSQKEGTFSSGATASKILFS
jgi:hypothetical protein